MLTRNELFGILTGLVEEHRKTENFFQALKFKNNFFKINTIMNGLINTYDNIEVKECFDYESILECQREFRYIIFVSFEGLEDYLLDNYGDLIDSIENDKNTINLVIK